MGRSFAGTNDGCVSLVGLVIEQSPVCPWGILTPDTIQVQPHSSRRRVTGETDLARPSGRGLNPRQGEVVMSEISRRNPPHFNEAAVSAFPGVFSQER